MLQGQIAFWEQKFSQPTLPHSPRQLVFYRFLKALLQCANVFSIHLSLLATTFLRKPRASVAAHVRELAIPAVILTFTRPEPATGAGVVTCGACSKSTGFEVRG